MDKHEKRHFIMTLVAAFVSTHRYMQRNYLPAKAVKKHHRCRDDGRQYGKRSPPVFIKESLKQEEP